MRKKHEFLLNFQDILQLVCTRIRTRSLITWTFNCLYFESALITFYVIRLLFYVIAFDKIISHGKNLEETTDPRFYDCIVKRNYLSVVKTMLRESLLFVRVLSANGADLNHGNVPDEIAKSIARVRKRERVYSLEQKSSSFTVTRYSRISAIWLRHAGDGPAYRRAKK